MTLPVEIRNLSVNFGKVTAIDDLSFSLEGGKIHGLLGRNGAGKTTLLTILASFRKPSGGSVLVDGQDPFENAELMRQICLIRESLDVDTDSKAKDAFEFVADLRPNWDQDYADHLVERFGLPLDRTIDKMSRGMKSMTGAIIGLAGRTPLTMFDETYLGMDAPSRYIFYDELLKDYLEYPRTIVLSTHLIQEVEALFEEVVIIDKGRLVIHDETEALRGRGAAVTGPASAVDEFTQDLKVLGERRLGGTKSSTVYGAIAENRRRQATELGLELEPLTLQDLFVHLTGAEAEK